MLSKYSSIFRCDESKVDAIWTWQDSKMVYSRGCGGINSRLIEERS